MATQASSKNSAAKPRNPNESLSEAYEHIQGATANVKEAVSAFSANSSEAARKKMHEGRERAEVYGQSVDTWVKTRPYTTMGIAFAAGLVLSRVLKK